MQQNLSYINPGGLAAQKVTALQINSGAARGLQDVLKSNLGPKGTMKMLVSGAGLIKITKDGNTLLGEMQIQHPTATLVARAATATDDTTGDGTTSTVIVIGEVMRQCERYIYEGLHPRLLTEGLDVAKEEAVRYLKSGALSVPLPEGPAQRDMLTQVAKTALSTKVGAQEKSLLANAVTDAVIAIRTPGEPIDLHMVEIMHMKNRLGTDTSFIRGLVLDHGCRNNDMPSRLENCYVLTLNVSLEYERSELAAGFYYSDPAMKKKMAASERRVTDEKTQDIIDLKNKLCTKENGRNFVVINQKGIDGVALEMLAKAGIMALRRAKRRNMERLVLACGGEALNTTENMTEDVLGHAGLVYEQVLGDEKYTFVEQVPHTLSCTILVRGFNDHTISQIKDALRDGLRAVKNAFDDNCVVPGAGAFEVKLNKHIYDFAETVPGKIKLGVRAFADSLLCIPNTLAANSGHDVQASLIAVQEASNKAAEGSFVGLDLESGGACDPVAAGIFDNLAVKLMLVETAGVIASQLLLVDEIMKTGRRGCAN